MKYAKDTNDNPSVATTTDALGNIVQSGSVTARNLIIAAIDHADMVEVVHAGKSGVPPGTNELRLSINQINQFINGSVNVDNRTLGWGMTFMHELHHTQVGGGLDDSPGNPGPVVTQMNIIRSELNAQGGNYGQRLDYMATPFGTYNYIPFSNSARNSIINGSTPRNSVNNKFIKY